MHLAKLNFCLSKIHEIGLIITLNIFIHYSHVSKETVEKYSSKCAFALFKLFLYLCS